MQGMAQTSVTLNEISVTAGTMAFGQSIGFFAYGVPNYFPSTWFGQITQDMALDSGLAASRNLDNAVANYGTTSGLYYLDYFSFMDKWMLQPGATANTAWQAAGIHKHYGSIQQNLSGVNFSGGPFSTYRALNHYIKNSGSDAFVPLDKLGLNVKAMDIPVLSRLIKEKANSPGTYQFVDNKFGYQTYKDSILTASYLGGIVLKAHGTLIIGEDKTFAYSVTISAERPDLYDPDPKPDGARPLGGESSTAILREIPGTPYKIYMEGEQIFQGRGDINGSGDFQESLIGDSYDNILRSKIPNINLTGGPGNDTYSIYDGSTRITENYEEGFDKVVTTVDFTIPDNVENIYLAGSAVYASGNSANNYILGNFMNNTLIGKGGDDIIDGDEGFDLAVYADYASNFDFVSSHGRTVVITRSEGTDNLYEVEAVVADNRQYVIRENILQYVASHGDLIDAFGSNLESGYHAVLDNYAQFNTPSSHKVTFDGGEYLVANRDVYAAKGFDPEQAAKHYIDSGRFEGRVVNFDSLAYIASNRDLIDAYGLDRISGSWHYLMYGEQEGRRISFNAENYMRKNPDVAFHANGNSDIATEHYIKWGVHEGRDFF